MTYNNNIMVKNILNEFLNKQIIELSVYVEMVNNASNYLFVEDFLIHSIINFNISYRNYPQAFKNDDAFLRKVYAARPQLALELKKFNKKKYNDLFAVKKTKKVKVVKSNKTKESRIKKITFAPSREMSVM